MLNKDVFFERFTKALPGEVFFRKEIIFRDEKKEIFFEPLNMAGLEEMHKYSAKEELYEFLEYLPFSKIETTQKYLQSLLDRMESADSTARYWFLRKKYDGSLIGTACLVQANYERQSIEWGYAIDPDLWGHGYILTIQEILKHFTFEVLELNRLSGVTMATNQRTISSLMASGFKNEGILRNYFKKENKYIDGWQYSLLREEYLNAPQRTIQAIKIPYAEIIDLLAGIFVDDHINENASIDNVISWDSFSHMEMLIAIKDRFGILFTPDEAMNAISVKNIFLLLNKSHEKK